MAISNGGGDLQTRLSLTVPCQPSHPSKEYLNQAPADSSDWQTIVSQKRLRSSSAPAAISGSLQKSTLHCESATIAGPTPISQESTSNVQDTLALVPRDLEQTRTARYAEEPPTRGANSSSTDYDVLYSPEPFRRNYFYLIALSVITTVTTCYTVYYAYNATLAPNPNLTLLWPSPDTTIFTVNLLAQITVILLTELTNVACNHYRWGRVALPKGMTLPTFLALGVSVSPFALVGLVIAGFVVLIFKKEIRSESSEWIAFQRSLNPTSPD